MPVTLGRADGGAARISVWECKLVQLGTEEGRAITACATSSAPPPAWSPAWGAAWSATSNVVKSCIAAVYCATAAAAFANAS